MYLFFADLCAISGHTYEHTDVELNRSADQPRVLQSAIMTLAEMLPTIQTLPRGDKLRLIQLLAADVARDEGIALDVADTTVPIWSPHDSFQGAATLLRVLDEDKVAS